jgi:plasmid stabilization system protein ParE
MKKNLPLLWSEPALLDLREAVDYIRTDNPSAAQATAARIRQGLERLPQFPRFEQPGPARTATGRGEDVVSCHRRFLFAASVFVFVWACSGSDSKPESSEGDVSGQPADTQAVDAGDKEDQREVDDGCPEENPWLSIPWNTIPQSWACNLADGTVCSWPAEGCAPGQKPDNVCTCVDRYGDRVFECERPFHNCLPLEGTGGGEGTLERPVPGHRDVAEVCEPTLAPRDDPTCTPRQGPYALEGECQVDSDCAGEGARCLNAWVFAGDTTCRCFSPECHVDADCPGTDVCACGRTDTSGDYCNGPGPSCMHRCRTSDCRTDADCPEGQFCSPSYDECGWTLQGYHCHDPKAAECFSGWECMGWNWGCNFVKSTGWICQEQPLCD